jgi:2-methylisocitrate lyase-like PEP mutase family enzyme
MERAHAYAEAGADMLFVEAPGSAEELSRVVAGLKDKLPLMANMVEGGRTPIKSTTALEELGFSLVIFPGGIVRALARAAQDFYASLKGHGTTDPFRDRMFDFDQLNAVIGTPEMIAAGKAYEGKP